LDSEIFNECLDKNKTSKSWNLIAEQNGFASGEVLRSAFRREKRRRETGLREVNNNDSQSEKSTYRTDGENIWVSYKDDHIPSMDEIAEKYKVNLNDWQVKDFEVTDWNMGRKDIEKDIRWEGGKIADGSYSKDSGKLNKIFLHRINVRFIRKTEEIRTNNIVLEQIEDAKNFAPKYEKIEYPAYEDGMLYELDIFDLHFGRLCWAQESGSDYDVKIARDNFNKVLDELLAYSKLFHIEKILIPICGDFFNVNNKANTTVHNTIQQEDTRWQKTFKLGRELVVETIDKCSQVSPVDILFIKGNHDEERLFYLGDSIESWYNCNPNVNVDNGAKGRKYYSYGKNLIGFAHGSEEKLDKLPMLMALEVPELWSKSIYREWHSGDKHRKFDTSENAVVVRILRSLTAPDAWTYDKGFVGSKRALESFLWTKNGGITAQFSAFVRE
jgi:hypothetical protein